MPPTPLRNAVPSRAVPALVALALAAMTALAALPAQAQAEPPPPPAATPAQIEAIRTACAADVRKLCPEAGADGARLIQCLRDRREEALPPCQASIAALVASLRKPRP